MDYVKASGKTAISRNKPSAPMRMLEQLCKLKGDMLDYGCGKGKDAWHYGMSRFDPNFCSAEENLAATSKTYDVVTCNYVLNTLPKKEAWRVICEVLFLLKPNGKAYFTVRRDIKGEGMTKRGTYQRNVILPMRSIIQTSSYEIYEARHPDTYGEN